MVIDATAGGALMGKERDKAYKLLEEMASNNYQWQSDRATPKKITGLHELDAISTSHAQLALLTKKLDATNASAIQTQNSSYDSYSSRQSSNNGLIANFVCLSNEQANYVSNC